MSVSQSIVFFMVRQEGKYRILPSSKTIIFKNRTSLHIIYAVSSFSWTASVFRSLDARLSGTCSISQTAELMNICCRDQGSCLWIFFFFWLQETKTTWTHPLHLQFSDLLNGRLILSLEHLISKFNRWMGGRSRYLTPVCCVQRYLLGEYSQDVTIGAVWL